MQTEKNFISQTTETANEFNVPWSLREILWGFLIIILFSFAAAFVASRWKSLTDLMLILFELFYLIPVILFVLLKKATLKVLGFHNFSLENLAIGCGLLFGAYIIIIIHNLALLLFGITTQSQYFTEIFSMDTINLWALGFAVVLAAPIAEEIFFRSFLFAGLSDKYGWKKAAFISAFIFSVAHMQLAALIPTFLMGLVLAYLYQRSRSVIPGIILHFTVNAFGFSMIGLALFLQENFPELQELMMRLTGFF